jgi:hypothetical protein
LGHAIYKPDAVERDEAALVAANANGVFSETEVAKFNFAVRCLGVLDDSPFSIDKFHWSGHWFPHGIDDLKSDGAEISSCEGKSWEEPE